MAAADGALDQTGLDPLDGVDQADVGGDVDDPHLGVDSIIETSVGAGELGEQLGVAGEDVAAGVQRLLVERRGADGLHLAGHRELAGHPDVVVCRVARDGGELAEGQVLGEQPEVDDVDPAGRNSPRTRRSTVTMSGSSPTSSAAGAAGRRHRRRRSRTVRRTRGRAGHGR